MNTTTAGYTKNMTVPRQAQKTTHGILMNNQS